MIVQGGGGSYRPTSAHFAPLERVGSSHLGQRLAYPSEQWWERTTEWSLRERFGPALRVVRIRAPHLKQSALARWPVLGRMLPADLQRIAVMLASLPSRLMMSCYYLLVVAALRAGERAHLAGTEGWDDGRLVPVEDVPTLLAPLTEGYDRASLVHDLAPRHLYRHRCNLQIHHPVRKIVLDTSPRPAPVIVLIVRSIMWYLILNGEAERRDLRMRISQKFESLRDRYRRPDGTRWNGQQLQDATGGGGTRSHLNMKRKEEVEGIRTGALENPTLSQVVALADAFGVHPYYFFETGNKPALLGEQEISALADQRARAILNKSLTLSDREKDMVLDMIQHLGELHDHR